jgi:hypothetical protein
MSTAIRPAPAEFAPFYGRYIDLVPDAPIVETLNAQIEETMSLLGALPESKGAHRYEPAKWSIKEVIGHLADSERIFAYRALRFARNDATPLPGFEENDYVPAANFGARSLQSLLDELRAVRKATVLLFDGLDEAAMDRRGTAAGNPVTVRALAYIIAGHERHHARILKERYLG